MGRTTATLLAAAWAASCATIVDTTPEVASLSDAAVQKACAPLVTGRRVGTVQLPSGERFDVPGDGDFWIPSQTRGSRCLCGLRMKDGILLEKRVTDCPPPR
jgi:hypothetical protein